MLSRNDILILCHFVAGTTVLQSGDPGKCSGHWNEALKAIQSGGMVLSGYSLQESVNQEKWRRKVHIYLTVLAGLHATTHCSWTKVAECIHKLDRLMKPPVEGFLSTLALYLKGVYEQGRYRLEKALRIFEAEQFAMDKVESLVNAGRLIEAKVSCLAAINRVLIMQHKTFRDARLSAELIESLRRVYDDNLDPEIMLAFNILMSAIKSEPQLTVNELKTYIKAAYAGTKGHHSNFFLAYTLLITHYRLFDNVVGDQGLKSARTAWNMATRSGNKVLTSVGCGRYSGALKLNNYHPEADRLFIEGVRSANEARRRAL